MGRVYRWKWTWDPKTRTLKSGQRTFSNAKLVCKPFGKYMVFEDENTVSHYAVDYLVLDSSGKQLWSTKELNEIRHIQNVRFVDGSEYLMVVYIGNIESGNETVIYDSDLRVVKKFSDYRDEYVFRFEYLLSEDQDEDCDVFFDGGVDWVKRTGMSLGEGPYYTFYDPKFNEILGPVDTYFWTGDDCTMLATKNKGAWSLFDWNAREYKLEKESPDKFKYALGLMHLKYVLEYFDS